MTSIVGIPIALMILAAACWATWRGARHYLRFRGTRVVTCPETRRPAAVEMATWHIAVTSTFRRPELRLRDCSRWHERAPCGQACLRDIEAAPGECLVLTILSEWYRDKICVCCGRPLGPVKRWAHRPCLMSPSLQICEWQEIEPEQIPQVLETHAPVCWTCRVAETHTF